MMEIVRNLRFMWSYEHQPPNLNKLKKLLIRAKHRVAAMAKAPKIIPKVDHLALTFFDGLMVVEGG